MTDVRPITLDEIRAARVRIAGTILRTPLVKLELGPGYPDIRLKLENLQPINSFKLRGAANEAPVSFYRTAAGAEVDLIIEGRRNRRYAIEVKRSSAPTLSRGFWNGRDDVDAHEALVIYPGDERIPIGDRTEALGLQDALTWVRNRVAGNG